MHDRSGDPPGGELGGPGERVLHEARRAQHRVGEAGLDDRLLGLMVQAPEGDRGVGRHPDHRQLDQVPDTGLRRRPGQVALMGADLKRGRVGDIDGSDALERRRQRARLPQVGHDRVHARRAHPGRRLLAAGQRPDRDLVAAQLAQDRAAGGPGRAADQDGHLSRPRLRALCRSTTGCPRKERPRISRRWRPRRDRSGGPSRPGDEPPWRCDQRRYRCRPAAQPACPNRAGG